MKNDGGQAFPSLVMVSGPNGDRPVLMGGMSLRDYFASAAMQGAMANERLLPSTEDELNHLAMRVYEMADAMLAEREKP